MSEDNKKIVNESKRDRKEMEGGRERERKTYRKRDRVIDRNREEGVKGNERTK
mgnify:CR=1 FL=1